MFYSKIVIDITTDRVLEKIPLNYTGPIIDLKGGSKQSSTTTVNIPPPTQEETQARAMSNYINELSLADQGYVFAPSGPPPTGPEWQSIGGRWLRKKTEADFTPEERRDKEINDLYSNKLLERARAGFGATPEEKAQIEKIYGTQRTKGKESIRQFMAELSGSRGMDISSSTPMARELARASGELEEGLGAAQSASELDFGERARNFGQEMRSFQEGLHQRAFENRMNIGGAYGNQASNLGQMRYGSASQTSTSKTKGGGGGFNLGGLLGGAGSMMSGMGAMGLMFPSRRELKEDIKPLDTIALATLQDMPVYSWRYKKEFDPTGRIHIGPMVNDAPEVMRTANDLAFDPISYLGVTTKAIQELDKRTRRFMDR